MFEHYIPLGGMCGVAESMKKLGTREFSGPFDWLISPIAGMVECMENDFAEFLDKDIAEKTLHMDKLWMRWVVTNRYGFIFPHEFTSKPDLEKNFDNVVIKYQRRIENFRKAAREKACFIRLLSPGERKFAEQNRQRIENLIKSYNSENEIIYLQLESTASGEYGAYPCWNVAGKWIYRTKELDLASLFDDNAALRQFLTENYPSEKRDKNLAFFARCRLKKLEEIEERFNLVKGICGLDAKNAGLPQKIIIYGASYEGKLFCDKVRGVCEVSCFVDRRKMEDAYADIPIMSYEDFVASEFTGETVIVTPAYLYGVIAPDLKRDGVNNVVSLAEFI